MCSSSQRDRAVEVGAGRRGKGADPQMRASDADRERVLDSLRDHGAAGRLTTEELEERADRVLAARTFGELDEVLVDLPGKPARRSKTERHELARRGYSEHLRTYLMVMALLVAIWALTGAGYFWPVWPMLGWGFGIACHRASLPRGARRGAARHAIARG